MFNILDLRKRFYHMVQFFFLVSKFIYYIVYNKVYNKFIIMFIYYSRNIHNMNNIQFYFIYLFIFGVIVLWCYGVMVVITYAIRIVFRNLFQSCRFRNNIITFLTFTFSKQFHSLYLSNENIFRILFK